MPQTQSQPNTILTSLKRLAYHRAKRTSVSPDEFEDYLKMWWSEKYHLPDNHPLLLDKTLEELVVDYFTDVFRNRPEETKEFEQELGVSDRSSEDNDEEWFKKTMGNDYTPDSPSAKTDSKKTEEFEDKY